MFQYYNIDSKIVELNTILRDIHLDINRAIPCGLILNELLTNSMKYAFPGGKKGEISIRLHSDKEGKIILIFSDNGIGLPENVGLGTPKSLGLELVKNLVEQLRGSVELERDGGTKFTIIF